ncbi:MAG: hypothetical protein QNJ41_28380 [Xenococcaceae cyanobacterium MO_188.B32]|nr:hypothetical protein [Xenococcaceae cyanobacterium MO_188.B32]
MRVFSDAVGSIIGFEDVRLNLGSNPDYNDIVLGIEGATAIGISAIEDVIHGDGNWLATSTSQEMIHYFETAI